MSLALNYCWKEWRAQRGLLFGYALLMTACLCLGLYLVPGSVWIENDFGSRVLMWFAGAGVLGVLALVVPGLVSREFVGKDDQLIRRLPGALLSSFLGKALFLLLVTVTLPLLLLLAGETFLTIMGREWDWRFLARYGELEVVGVSLVMVPWLWAVGMWLPRGRLALLGAVLLALVLGMGVFAVERQSPRIFWGINWWRYAWIVSIPGTLVAGLSWCRGRRGGGAWRSARVGLIGTAIVVLPFAGWVGHRAIRYHYPDPNNLQSLTVKGMSPDGRFALVHGAEEPQWYGMKLRLDLETGEASRVSGFQSALTPQVVYPASMTMNATQRYWRAYCLDDQHFVYDMATDKKHRIGFDPVAEKPVLPEQLHAEVSAEVSAGLGLVTPDGGRVLARGNEFVFLSPDGREERVPVPVAGVKSMRAAGHAVQMWGSERGVLFDLVRRQLIRDPGMKGGLKVGQCLLFGMTHGANMTRSNECLIKHADGATEKCEPLRGCQVMGLFDHQRVLAIRKEVPGMHSERLFLFDPATGEETECQQLDGVSVVDCYAVTPMNQVGSLLGRDPMGEIWFRHRRYHTEPFIRLDPDTLQARPVPALRDLPMASLLRWQELPHVVVQDRSQIVRVHLETGERTVLFPRR